MLLELYGNIAIPTVLSGTFLVLICILYSSWTSYSKLYMVRSNLLYPWSSVKKRAKAWTFLFRGPQVIQEGYNKENGAPYEVFAPDNRYVFVSSDRHIREIDAAPDSELSLQAAAKQLLQPKYTMHKFDWFDQRGVDDTPLVRTLRALLTNHISKILPNIHSATSAIFDQQVDLAPLRDGAKSSPLYPMVKEAVVFANALAFFGPELAHDKGFLKSATNFIERTLLIAEINRLVPECITHATGKILTYRYTTDKAVFAALLLVVERRLEERTQDKLGHSVAIHKDCIQWVMDTSPKTKPWSGERIVHELMALWFGSVHILTTTICFAVQDLCLHPEYIEPLRKELEGAQRAGFRSSGKGLLLLDSFIRESARTTPVESMSTRRQALQPFSLSGGWKVDVGEWVCTPASAIMKDPAYYAEPQEFHGFRFVDPGTLREFGDRPKFKVPQPGNCAQLTDLDWPLWGTGRMACPGRFYAAAVMKTIIALFITKYDLRLSEAEKSRWFIWRTSVYPKPSTAVLLRSRLEPTDFQF